MAAAYHGDLAAIARRNEDFRRVLHTDQRSQLVLMSIAPGTDIGPETHGSIEQTLFFVSGRGLAVVGGKRFAVHKGTVVVVPPGTRHDFINTGRVPLKLYTTYVPPAHIRGRVHRTKADAEADQQDAAYGDRAR